jgi:hypothetical protein
MLGTHLRGLGLLVGGKESVGDGALQLTYWLGFAPVEYGGRGQSNLESTADTEDTVIGLLGGKTLDGLLDILALLRDQVIEPSCEVSRCFCPTLPRTISERPGLQANSTQPRSHSKDVPPVRDEFDQPIPSIVSIALGRDVIDIGGQELLESESPVAGGIGVPVGEGGEPALEPWALDDVTGERRGRHFESRVSQLTWVWWRVERLSDWNTR